MITPSFGTNNGSKPATGQNINTEGESEMNSEIKTTKVSKWNKSAKIIGGLALGALLAVVVPLQAGITLGDSPTSPLTANATYAEQRHSDSLEERMEVQRIRAENFATTNPASINLSYSEMRVADSLEERMELQRIRAGGN